MKRPIEASWLAVRRAADSTARGHSAALVQQLVGSLPGLDPGARQTLTVVDVGAGTGANQAWLGPALAAAGCGDVQDWHLVDHDPTLLELAAGDEAPGLVPSTRHRAGVREVSALLRQHTRPRLVTCSALLDLLTAGEVDALVEATLSYADAALWALSVTGEVEVSPHHPDDRLVTALFNADQQRVVADDRRLLGPAAWRHAARGLRDGGWQVRRASTPWVLGPAENALVRRWVRERAEAAAGATSDAGQRARARAWGAARGEQLEAGGLSVRVGHTDLLALPGSVISVQTSSPSW